MSDSYSTNIVKSCHFSGCGFSDQYTAVERRDSEVMSEQYELNFCDPSNFDYTLTLCKAYAGNGRDRERAESLGHLSEIIGNFLDGRMKWTGILVSGRV